jgi:hypothetical protein
MGFWANGYKGEMGRKVWVLQNAGFLTGSKKPAF